MSTWSLPACRWSVHLPVCTPDGTALLRMNDFYASSKPAPLDQAHGLRRMFAGRRQAVLPLVANPFVAFSGVVLDRLAAVLAAAGRKVLVVDASAGSPPPHELAALDLAACIETVSKGVLYLPASGLPMTYVDTRGFADGFIDALHRAAPQVDVVLLHADAQDLTRIFKRRAARPVLLGADHPDSIKHAYAGAKLLATRCSLMTFDLLLAAPPHSPRLGSIAQSLAGCADTFLGAAICHVAVVDPAGEPHGDPDPSLNQLLAAQMSLDDAWAPAAQPAAPSAPAARTAFR